MAGYFAVGMLFFCFNHFKWSVVAGYYALGVLFLGYNIEVIIGLMLSLDILYCLSLTQCRTRYGN